MRDLLPGSTSAFYAKVVEVRHLLLWPPSPPLGLAPLVLKGSGERENDIDKGGGWVCYVCDGSYSVVLQGLTRTRPKCDFYVCLFMSRIKFGRGRSRSKCRQTTMAAAVAVVESHVHSHARIHEIWFLVSLTVWPNLNEEATGGVGGTQHDEGYTDEKRRFSSKYFTE